MPQPQSIMNFNIWSLLFGVATVILVEGTRPQRSVTGQIRFCNEVDCDSPCQVEDLEFGKCKPILGFVAAGDRGSSIYVSVTYPSKLSQLLTFHLCSSVASRRKETSSAKCIPVMTARTKMTRSPPESSITRIGWGRSGILPSQSHTSAAPNDAREDDTGWCVAAQTTLV